MEIQQSAFGGQSSAQVYNEVALLNSLASFATGPIGVAIGAVMYVGKLVNDAALNLLPSEITQLNLNYDGDIPHEDDEVIYQYTDMRVNAKSQGWNLKYVIIDGTLMFTGFSTRFEAIELNATTVIQTGGEVGSNLTSRVDVPDPNATGSAAEVMQVVDNFVTIPPFVWEDIPVRFEDIASVRVIAPPSATTPAIEIVSTQDGSYRAINEGRVYLRFEVVAGRKSLYLSKPIQVARIDVTWNQQTNVIINEGETVCFEAQINNALNTDGRFTIDGPSGIDTVETTEQPAQYCFTAPQRITREWTQPLDCTSEPALIPEVYSVEFESMTRAGARNPDINPSWVPRTRFSVIRVEPLPENHQDAVPPINENCTTFEGNWQFTLNPEQSFLCTGSELSAITSTVLMTAPDSNQNLRGAPIVIVDGLAETGILTMASEEPGVFITEGSYTEDGVSVQVETTLYLQGAEAATVIARGTSNLYSTLPPESQRLVPLCETIAFFFVYDGVYIGD